MLQVMTGMWHDDDRRTIVFNLAMYEQARSSPRASASRIFIFQSPARVVHSERIGWAYREDGHSNDAGWYARRAR